MDQINNDVQERYRRALDSLVGKLKEDSTVLAVVLMGSMSHDVVWEKSDIDLLIVTTEVKLKSSALFLTEDDVNIHAYLYTRSAFRKSLDGSMQSTFVHSLLSHGTMLFTRDVSLAEAYEARHEYGGRDRMAVAMRHTSCVIALLAKAEKWLTVRRDAHYCLVYILTTVQYLAGIETALQGEIAGREVIQQAIRLNPPFFTAVYTHLLENEHTLEAMQTAIIAIQKYLKTRAFEVFVPVLEYLEQERTARSATEIADHFAHNMRVEGVETLCEWLADEGIIRKIAVPVRVTEKSKISVEEAAYYFDGDIQELLAAAANKGAAK